MNFDETVIIDAQRETGFDLLYIEKVLRLLKILNLFFSDSILKDKYALKGGTALNLFYFKLPRLSVDIDLNYIGLERETMQKERAVHEQHLSALLAEKGYVVKRIPAEHAGGKWRLGYRSFAGIQQNIELDLNYMHRVPLLPLEVMDSFPLGNFNAAGTTLLNIHELAAGKLCALFARTKPRDLFDAYKLLHSNLLDAKLLRNCFIVYAAFNKVDFSRITSFDAINIDLQQFRQELIETLAAGIAPPFGEHGTYMQTLKDGCRTKISILLPFTKTEQEFLHNINHKGIIEPDLLDVSNELKDCIRKHPMLQWKIFNVRKHYGLT